MLRSGLLVSVLSFAVVSAACGDDASGPTLLNAPESADEGAAGGQVAEPAPADVAVDDEASRCASTREAAGVLRATIEANAHCAFDTDCAVLPPVGACGVHCGIATRADALVTLEGASEAGHRACVTPGCFAAPEACGGLEPRCEAGRCTLGEARATPATTEVPQENARTQRSPSARPSSESVQAMGARLFAAIQQDRPALARDFFFPREAFAHVKAMRESDRYWRRLYARYESDVHALHESLAGLEDATFERLEVVRRGGFVLPGEEGNRLPYWAARHNRLHYRVGDRTRTFEVRVLITWGPRWYLIHLNEFR